MSSINTPEGREWLRTLLSEQDLTISFIKKDGTARDMVCTLASDKIPAEQAPKNSGKAKSDESIAVFDVEKQEWRSFRWDSVTQISFEVSN